MYTPQLRFLPLGEGVLLTVRADAQVRGAFEQRALVVISAHFETSCDDLGSNSRSGMQRPIAREVPWHRPWSGCAPLLFDTFRCVRMVSVERASERRYPGRSSYLVPG